MNLLPDQLLKEVKQKKLQSLYFLHGDEPYYLEKIADEIERVAIPTTEKGFNQFVLFGKDIEVGQILNSARRFPFMAERQLVIVKEAQQISGFDNKDKVKLLEDYALSPLSSTILVICFQGNYDARKPLLKAFDKTGVVMQSKKLYDNKIPDWIASYVREQGIKISPKAIQMMAENIGNDLKRIVSEIDKMLINLTLGEEISAAVVEKYVGISKEYNIFELQKAITQRDVLRCNRIADYLAANPKDNPLPQVVSMLYNFFSKVLMVHGTIDKSEATLAPILSVNPFFVKDYLMAARQYPIAHTVNIIKAIRYADNASKGIVGINDEQVVLRELIYRILH
jgi:DNA polymerase III subunit delta